MVTEAAKQLMWNLLKGPSVQYTNWLREALGTAGFWARQAAWETETQGATAVVQPGDAMLPGETRVGQFHEEMELVKGLREKPRLLHPGPDQDFSLVEPLGGTFMSYQYNNGHAPRPGDPPPGTSLMIARNGQVQPASGDAIGILGLLLRGGSIALGLLRVLVARVGWQTIIAVVGTAVAAKLVAMLNDPDDNKKVSLKRRKKRYSIGVNPRLRTLIKVANRVDRTFNQYDKSVARFRSHVKGPARPRTRVYVESPRKDLTVVR